MNVLSDAWTRFKTQKITPDLVMGVIIMGMTGFVIGLNLGGLVLITMATLLGAILGGFVSMLGARRFFYSIIVGTVLGGALALILGGSYAFVIGVGTGGAVGGFVGINIELYMRG